MNDCVWCSIICMNHNCQDCDKKININSRNGRKIMKQYEEDVKKALEPIAKKYEEMMNKE